MSPRHLSAIFAALALCIAWAGPLLAQEDTGIARLGKAIDAQTLIGDHAAAAEPAAEAPPGKNHAGK